VSWNGATEVKGWRLETAKTQEAKDGEFVTIQELDRDGFETGFPLDRVNRYVRVAALDAAKDVMAYSAVVKAPPVNSHTTSHFSLFLANSTQILLWSTLVFVLSVTIFLFGFAGLVSLYRSTLWPPRFPNLSDLRTFRVWSYTTMMGTQKHKDPESAPLLLDETDRDSEPQLLNERGPQGNGQIRLH
jgi:hypothetical protein